MAGDPPFLKRYRTQLLFLAAFLLVAALASNLANLSEPGAPAPRPRAEPSVPGFLPAWLFALLVWSSALALLAAFVGVYLWVRRSRTHRAAMPWGLLAAALALTFVVPILLVWFMPGPFTPAGAADVTNQTANETATAGGGGGSAILGLPLQVVRTVPVLGIAIVVVVLTFALATLPQWLPRGRPLSPLFVPAPEEVSTTVRRAIEALDADEDPRGAILACYAALMALLVRHGLSDLEPLTPREVERRALAGLGLSERDINSLTTIFEEARYSDHPIGPETRDRARDAFRALQTSLEA